MRRLLLILYCCGVWGLLYLFCITPQRAMAVQYSRVVTLASRQAFMAAHRAVIIESVAAAALVPSPASLAIRAVTGPVGWASLGLAAGAMVYQHYYSGSDLASIKTAATPPSSHTVPISSGTLALPLFGSAEPVNPTYPAAFILVQNNNSDCQAQDSSYNHDYVVGPFPNTSTFFYQGPVFTGGTGAIIIGSYVIGNAGYYFCHRTGQAGTVGTQSGQATQQTIQDYMDGLSDSDPKSIEMHAEKGGQSGSPTVADNNVSMPVTPVEMPSVVKPEPVASDDVVLKTGVLPPTGTETEKEATQVVTSTTDPETGDTTETATVSCTSGDCDTRTIESIFAEHKATWLTSGFLSIFSVIQALTWPDELPVYTFDFSHTGFGTHTLDMNDYATTFIILRSFLIFFATWVGYRIILG